MNKKIKVNDGPLISRLNENLSNKNTAKAIKEFEDGITETYDSIRDCVSIPKDKAGLDLLKANLLRALREEPTTDKLNESANDGCKKLYTNPDIIVTEFNPTKPVNSNYEQVNHPAHYNNYDVEVIDMMRRIWGDEATALWCKMTAYKYRMRMGTKPDNTIFQDIAKENGISIRLRNYPKPNKRKILKRKNKGNP